jgi:hypothetical protein
VVGLIGPQQPISDVPVSETEGVVDAADDAFVEGIRAALVVAALLAVAALVAGYLAFPRGRRIDQQEGREEVELAAEETT